MRKGHCVILFHKPGFNLPAAADVLAAGVLTVRPHGEQRMIQWGTGPELYLSYRQGPAVALEAADLGDGTSHAAALRTCDQALDIDFADLDEVLDEINTLIEVQATLQDATQGYLFCYWNGNLAGPND